jgi:hypothetical protein
VLQTLVRTDFTIPRSLSTHNNWVKASRRVTSAALNFSVRHALHAQRLRRRQAHLYRLPFHRHQ